MNTVQHQTKQTAGINRPGGIIRDEVTRREHRREDGSGLVGVGWPQAGHCSGARYLLPCLPAAITCGMSEPAAAAPLIVFK